MKTRKFDGKAYLLVERDLTKDDAHRVAKKMQDKGFLARIAPSSNPRRYGYAVYYRHPQASGR